MEYEIEYEMVYKMDERKYEKLSSSLGRRTEFLVNFPRSCLYSPLLSSTPLYSPLIHISI